MVALNNIIKKLVIITVVISILISFSAIPASYAKLDIKSEEFYYSGTQKGQYVAKAGVFSWIVNSLAEVADWIVGAISTAIRAPFIGWTALIERLLTGALEATAGIDMDNNISNTDLDSIIHSEKNVTVQAIVYNQVPALNVNFFDTDYNKNNYSPTGTELICSKCNEPCEKCIGKKDSCNTTCTCGGTCDACETYMKLKDAKPLFVEFKNYVSFWYYVIRIIALVAMLALFVFIGIKIAITNIASEKATYKRMLVDWVVGILIIFLLHYFMIFIIYLNDTLVDTVRTSANDINTVKMMELAEDSSSEIKYTNKQIELDIYEEVRTRAYDAKFVNGLIGTILYMALVYMAVRYTVMYLKRLLTVAILILMGPGVGFAYAFQKALSGRSMAIKKWLSEYIINIIIQTVHAIIYAVFISTVLVLSLKSISGVIIAFIMMNFSLKAELIFRKIFNLEKSSLLKETDKSGNIEERARDAIGTYKGVTSMAKNIGNSFYGNGIKGVAKVAFGAPLVAASYGIDKVNNILQSESTESNSASESNSDFSSTEDESSENNSESIFDRDGSSSSTGDTNSTNRAGSIPLGDDIAHSHRPDEELKNMSMNELEEVFEIAKEEYHNDPDNEEKKEAYILANNDIERKMDLESITTKDVVIGHAQRLIDLDNYFDISIGKDGKRHRILKKGAILGTSHYDPETRKYVSDKNSAARQLGVSKLFGLTNEDITDLKGAAKESKRMVTGPATILLSAGSVIFNPKVALPMLISSSVTTYSASKKLGYIPTINNAKTLNNKEYNFAGFSTPTLLKIKDDALDRIKAEQDRMNVQRIRDKHPILFNNLRTGFIAATTLFGGFGAGALAFSAVKIYDKSVLNKEEEEETKRDLKRDLQGRPMAYNITSKTRYKVRKVSPLQDAVNLKLAKRVKEEAKEFEKDALDLIALQAKVNAQNEVEKYVEKEREEILENMGYEEDKETGELYKIEKETVEPPTSEDEKGSDTEETSTETKDDVISKDELVEEIDGRKITDVDNRKVNECIEETLMKISGNEEIVINSEAKINQVIKELNSELTKSKVILKDQSAEDIFKGGRNGLVTTIKKKTKKVNKKIRREKEIFEKLNSVERSSVKEAVDEALKIEKGKMKTHGSRRRKSVYDNVNQNEVLDRVLKKVSAVSNPTAQNGPVNSNSDNSSNTQTGNHDINNKDNPFIINPEITEEKKEQYRGAIRSYILMKKDDSITPPKKRNRIDTSTRIVKKRVSENEKKIVLGKLDIKLAKKKSKFQQALEVYVEDPTEGLNALNEDEDINNFNLSKLLEQVNVMRVANERGDELDLKGSSTYKRIKKEKDNANAAHLQAQVDILKIEQEMKLPLDYETSVDYHSLSLEEKIKMDDIRKRKRKLKILEKDSKEKKRKANNAGPVIDIKDVINTA